MDKLKTIFNGNPDSGVGNIQRAGMAAMIPIMMGLGGATIQLSRSPELGIIPGLIIMLVPASMGILEMFRQFKIIDRKNEEMDDRTFDRLVNSFDKTDTFGLYKHKK